MFRVIQYHEMKARREAEFFAGKGFVVAGNDHLGHGDSVNDEEDYGYFAKGSHGADYLIKDMHRLTRIMKKMYRDIPYILGIAWVLLWLESMHAYMVMNWM